jgi:hypothetical protein
VILKVYLLEHNAVWSVESQTVLHSFTLFPCLTYYSVMKMQVTCSSETSVDFQWTTRRYNPPKTLQRKSRLVNQRQAGLINCKGRRWECCVLHCNMGSPVVFKLTGYPFSVIIVWLVSRQSYSSSVCPLKELVNVVRMPAGYVDIVSFIGETSISY